MKVELEDGLPAILDRGHVGKDVMVFCFEAHSSEVKETRGLCILILSTAIVAEAAETLKHFHCLGKFAVLL